MRVEQLHQTGAHRVTVSNIVINTHSSQAFRMSTNELSSSSGSQDFRQSLVSRRGLVLRNFNILLTLSRDWSAGFCQSQQKNVNCLQSDGDFHTDLMNDLQPRSSSTRGASAQVRLSGDGSCDVHWGVVRALFSLLWLSPTPSSACVKLVRKLSVRSGLCQHLLRHSRSHWGPPVQRSISSSEVAPTKSYVKYW